MKITIVISVLCLILICGCSKGDTAEGIADIGIDFVWDLEHLNRSPDIQLKDVPKGVEHIEINFFCDMMHDPHRERGGGTLPYDGSGIIPAGTFNSFSIPKSLMGIMLETSATVKAFDKDGQLIGKGTTTKKPPNK